MDSALCVCYPLWMRVQLAGLFSLPILLAAAPSLALDPGSATTSTPTAASGFAARSEVAPVERPVGLLAFSAMNPTLRRFEIYTVRTDGSRLVQLTTTGGYGPAWSPDGTRIAYERRGKVWLMNADGGGRQSVAPGGLPSWAPDGQHLSYRCDQGGGLCIMDLSTRAVTVPFAATDDWQGAGLSSWSPDGTWIVFTRYSTNGDDYTVFRNLWIVHPDGTGLAEVPNTGTQANDPAWSPDGTKIIYTNRYDGRGGEGSGDLFAIDPDGTGTTQLTTEYGNEGSASWSPDGTRIAVTSDAGYRRYQAGIWTMDPNGTDRELVFRTGYEPSWHPTFSSGASPPPPPPRADSTGQLIAYIAVTDTGYNLFTVRPDGTGQRQRTTDGAAEPAWSPDHRRLAYLHNEVRIRVVNVRTSETRVIRTRFAGSGPDWSPDGNRLVWSESDSLVVYNLRDGERRRISLPEFNIKDPAWSPDGTWIAYGEESIKVVRATGGSPRVVTDLPGHEAMPAWSPDGQWIAFTREEGQGWQRSARIAQIRPDGGRASRILRTGGVDAYPSWNADGTRFAVYSDGRRRFGSSPQPGLWTMTRAGGDTQLVVSGRAIIDVAW